MTTNPKPNKALKVGKKAEWATLGGGEAVAEPRSVRHQLYLTVLFHSERLLKMGADTVSHCLQERLR